MILINNSVHFKAMPDILALEENGLDKEVDGSISDFSKKTFKYLPVGFRYNLERIYHEIGTEDRIKSPSNYNTSFDKWKIKWEFVNLV